MYNVVKNAYDKQYTDASDIVDSVDIRMDIRELQSHIMIHIDLPGVKKDTIGLYISDDNVFELKAERNLYDTATDKFYVKERLSGKIQRTIPLPKNVDKDSINASYEDGVLNVKILKLLEKKTSKQIFIN
jgi:HSP20 family protein